MREALKGNGFALTIIAGGVAALAVSSVMNFLFGNSVGATSLGKWTYSIASVVCHVGGIIIFGMVLGRLLRAGRLLAAIIPAVIVVLATGWSILSMAGFGAVERLSAAQSRQEAMNRDKRADALQERHIKRLEGMATVRDRSRTERRMYLEASSSEIAKSREGSGEIRLIPDAQADFIVKGAGWFGKKWTVEGVQIGLVTWLSVLLILLEASAFPYGSYHWNGRLAEAGSPPANQQNSGGSGGSGGGEPRKLKQVHPEPRPAVARTMQAQPTEPHTQSSAHRSVISTDAPKGKLTYEQFVHTLRQDMADGDLASSTRALKRETGWSQSSVVRHARRLKEKARPKMERYAGNGGGRHASARG